MVKGNIANGKIGQKDMVVLFEDSFMNVKISMFRW